MLAAIGITLILKEIPHALGYDKNFIGDHAFAHGNGHNTFSELYYSVKFSQGGAILISVVSIGILLISEQRFIKERAFFSYLPGALFVVIVGIILNQFFITRFPTLALTGEHLVRLPVATNAREFMHFFTFTDFSALLNPEVYTVAFTLAIVVSLETLLSVEATDKLDPQRRMTPTDRELKAQGIQYALGAGGRLTPVTQVIVRSSANIDLGGQTKLSTITHGILLFVSVVFIPYYLNKIPLAALAAILLLVGYRLSRLSLSRQMYRLGYDQFIPFIVTIGAILFTDLLKGIAIGMVEAVFFILQKKLYVFLLLQDGETPERGGYHTSAFGRSQFSEQG